jgi:hypothetical protein
VLSGVEYSIYFSASAAGLQTVNVLKAPTTLVGAIFSGQYLGIVIDSVRTAYIPNISANSAGVNTDTPMIPVVQTFAGLQINIVFQSAGQVGILYFGTPSRDAVPLSAYSGVIVNISGTNSGTSAANVTTSGVAQFPQGNILLTGLSYFSLDGNSSYDTWSFTTAGGLLVQGFSVGNIGAGGRFSVLPLNNIFTAQSLTINVTMYNVKASSTHSAVVVVYYQL